MIDKLALVAAGGAVGASLRFLVGRALVHGPDFPVATLVVNVAGSFAMGVLAVWLLERGVWAQLAPFALTGVLGGFTTFSAFSLEALFLIERGRFGEAVLYIALSVVLSLAALWAGLALGRALAP